MVRTTSARPSGGRPAVPAKMTSSILPPRNDLAPCSPRTQAIASTTLDLPEPLGPTTHVMPGSKRSVVDEAKDLKPRRVRLFRCTGWAPRRGQANRSAEAGKAAPNVAEVSARRGQPRRNNSVVNGGGQRGAVSGGPPDKGQTKGRLERRPWMGGRAVAQVRAGS